MKKTLNIIYYLLIIALVVVVFSGCGSRKVELQKRINDIETNLNLTIRELEVERSKIRIYENIRTFKADSIVEKKYHRVIYNPSSEEKEKGKEESIESEKINEKNIKEIIKDNSKEDVKKIDRDQFNWTYIILVVLGIGSLIVFKFK